MLDEEWVQTWGLKLGINIQVALAVLSRLDSACFLFLICSLVFFALRNVVLWKTRSRCEEFVAAIVHLARAFDMLLS